MNRKLFAIPVIALAAIGLTACESDADKARYNAGIAAEQFEVPREIIGKNTRSGEILFQYVGACSLESGQGESPLKGYLQITCKHGPSDIRVHYEKETPETAISSHQLDAGDFDVNRTRILVKPENLIPNPDVEINQ